MRPDSSNSQHRSTHDSAVARLVPRLTVGRGSGAIRHRSGSGASPRPGSRRSAMMTQPPRCASVSPSAAIFAWSAIMTCCAAWSGCCVAPDSPWRTARGSIRGRRSSSPWRWRWGSRGVVRSWSSSWPSRWSRPRSSSRLTVFPARARLARGRGRRPVVPHHGRGGRVLRSRFRPNARCRAGPHLARLPGLHALAVHPAPARSRPESRSTCGRSCWMPNSTLARRALRFR